MGKHQGKLLLKGIGASPGIYRGKVKIINRKVDNISISNGEIIVADFITPLEIILVLNAGAVITDHGGITSHAAVIAREIGIPCVVSTNNATKVLKNGMEVIVDGEEGTVYQS